MLKVAWRGVLLCGTVLGIVAGTPSSAFADGYQQVGRGYSPAAFSWSGLYVGASYGWANVDWDSIYVSPPPDRHSTNHSSGVVGGHIGYQGQFGKLVAGLEVGYNNLGRGWGSSLSPSADCLGATPIANRTCQNRMSDFVTLGARVGVTPIDRVLVYGGGGVAIGHLQTRELVTNTGAVVVPGNTATDGWYLSTGIEWAVTNHIVVGVEYQHVSLGTAVFRGDLPVNDQKYADVDTDIVRARLSFKLGAEDRRREPLK